MKKKIISLCLVVALGATAVVGGTLAYFTDAESKDNTFTVGNVDIELTEPNWDATGKVEAEDAYPGEALAKDPTVTNKGANPCFVRVSVSDLDQFGADNMITYRTDYVDGKLGDGWVLHTDGYYYYESVLEIGKTTDALFDQIVIPTGIKNNAQTAPIVVKAEAVQAQGARPSFSAVKEMKAADIAAWFAVCGL